ncbi:hypothetical protein NL108_007550 [Boleophthalmus pectinirostris]|nr:hypothetical protein NL108_007550 [Boleophthalmus pectinirostris]
MDKMDVCLIILIGLTWVTPAKGLSSALAHVNVNIRSFGEISNEVLTETIKQFFQDKFNSTITVKSVSNLNTPDTQTQESPTTTTTTAATSTLRIFVEEHVDGF